MRMPNTLMRSVSGVRGIVGTALTPEIASRYATAFARLVSQAGGRGVVLARDSRTSGPLLAGAVRSALVAHGVDVVDCGMVPTPTAQLAVEHHAAGGGIIVTASHNPIEWNALKFVGADGLFLDREVASRLFAMVDEESGIGSREAAGGRPPSGRVVEDGEAVERHLEAVLTLSVVDADRIRARGYTVALDCVRGVGGVIMPALLERLGCRVVGIDLDPDGRFPRPPEPVPEHLTHLGETVRAVQADIGMAVDPDGDRLALVDERGTAIGEDYTLAFAVRSVLERERGAVVTNLSTSLVVDDAAATFDVVPSRAPVGEANVAAAMRAAGAIVGGEGNGGVMLPALHVGRDAPVAAALALDLLARSGKTVAEVVSAQPRYVMAKTKLPVSGDLEPVYARLERRFADAIVDRQDGLRLAWTDRWMHLRPSGTEPVVRLIVEAPTARQVEHLLATARTEMQEGGE